MAGRDEFADSEQADRSDQFLGIAFAAGVCSVFWFVVGVIVGWYLA